MIRHPDGRPWFIHGVGFDISDLKRTEEELQNERNVVSAILDTVGALVVVLDRDGRIVRFNRACQQISGRSLEQTVGQPLWDVFLIDEEKEQFQKTFRQIWENRRARSTRPPGLRATAAAERLHGLPRCYRPPSKRLLI